MQFYLVQRGARLYSRSRHMVDSITFLRTAGLVALRDHRLLLAFSRNKGAWYLPGGKVDAGETTVQALVREIREELNVEIDPARLTLYCHIQAPAFGEAGQVWIDQDCFRYDLEVDIIPGNEIEEVAYFSPGSYAQEAHQVVGVLQVFEKLAQDGLVRPA